MSIKPEEMVDYAYGMLDPHGSEIEWRNAVNRAYYGAFLTARNQAGIKNSGGSVHRDVADYYRQSNPGVSNKLDNLKRLRETADYRPGDDVTYRDATSSCSRAKGILEDLAQN